MPGNEPPADAIDWSLTAWEGSRREQLRRWAALSLEEILLAQEEMRELAEKMRDRGEFTPASSVAREPRVDEIESNENAP